MATDKRPVNLDLFQFRFPITAIVSILHRVSGVALVLVLPLMLWLLDRSLRSETAFAGVKQMVSTPLFKLLILLIVAGLAYHISAGVRHYIMDMHIGDSLEGGRLGAFITIGAAAVITFLAGVWLW